MNPLRWSLTSLVAIYLALAGLLYLSWHVRGIYLATGDEPHYLVIADAVAHDHTLEQSQAYRREFASRAIVPSGLSPDPAATPSPANAHVVQGPHGLYNIHNVALPLLLALPLVAGGVVGAKLFMVFVAALAVVLAWRVTRLYTADAKTRWLVVFATCIGVPLIPGANQIYPDIPAGIACLAALLLLATVRQGPRPGRDALCIIGLALLPWLQIRYVAPCLLLAAALVVRLRGTPGARARIVALVVPIALSLALLAAYNQYAFGKPTGPYQGGALEMSRTSLMVLLGLHLDQNQGFLMQNPAMFAGLVGIGALFTRDRLLGTTWLLVFLSLIVPNALHPNWYGGWSFSGRFEWSAEIVFIMPTALALVALARHGGRAFGAFIGACAAAQLYFLYKCVHVVIGIYNKPPGTPLDLYSIFYYPVRNWMPAFYDPSWAFTYGPNGPWLAAAAGLVVAGILAAPRVARLLAPHAG